MSSPSSDVLRRLSARLKFRHLDLLLQIQQQGSLTRVAEIMTTSQPAVTNTLLELESMFGAPLFERSVRGMSPTPLGKIVLTRASAMIHDLGNLARDMEMVASGHAAHIHIGVIPFISGQMLSAAIQHAPLEGGARLRVTVHEGTSGDLLSLLQDHVLDIVIGRAASPLELRGIEFEVLFRQQPRLIANRRLASRLARLPLDWTKLADLDWILGPPLTPMRDQVANIFLMAGVAPPSPIVESYSSKLIGEMIVAGERSISVVPADIAEEMVRTAGVAILPYSFEWSLAPVAIFTRTDDNRRPINQLFTASFRKVCELQHPAQQGSRE